MDQLDPQRRQLADALRDTIRATRVTLVDEATMRQATALINEAAALLGSDTYPGPHCQTGFGTPGEWDMKTLTDFFPYSPAVGHLSPLAPKVELDTVHDEVDGEERKVVRARFELNEPYNGPPWDYTHGGVIALLFDELLGIATIVGASGGFTGRLTIHYRKPTPLFTPLELRAWVDRSSGRKLIVKGTLQAGDTTTAEAEGLFVQRGGVLTP